MKKSLPFLSFILLSIFPSLASPSQLSFPWKDLTVTLNLINGQFIVQFLDQSNQIVPPPVAQASVSYSNPSNSTFSSNDKSPSDSPISTPSATSSKTYSPSPSSTAGTSPSAASSTSSKTIYSSKKNLLTSTLNINPEEKSLVSQNHIPPNYSGWVTLSLLNQSSQPIITFERSRIGSSETDPQLNTSSTPPTPPSTPTQPFLESPLKPQNLQPINPSSN